MLANATPHPMSMFCDGILAPQSRSVADVRHVDLSKNPRIEFGGAA
jgi:hypothetical protein